MTCEQPEPTPADVPRSCIMRVSWAFKHGPAPSGGRVTWALGPVVAPIELHNDRSDPWITQGEVSANTRVVDKRRRNDAQAADALRASPAGANQVA